MTQQLATATPLTRPPGLTTTMGNAWDRGWRPQTTMALLTHHCAAGCGAHYTTRDLTTVVNFICTKCRAEARAFMSQATKRSQK